MLEVLTLHGLGDKSNCCFETLYQSKNLLFTKYPSSHLIGNSSIPQTSVEFEFTTVQFSETCNRQGIPKEAFYLRTTCNCILLTRALSLSFWRFNQH